MCRSLCASLPAGMFSVSLPVSETELLGLSIDSHYSHVAWMRNIKEKFGVEIPFPIIADLKMEVARAMA